MVLVLAGEERSWGLKRMWSWPPVILKKVGRAWEALGRGGAGEEKRGSLDVEPLSVDMKATLALIVSWMVFLIIGGVVALLNGPFDIYILLSFIILVPYGVFFWFGWKRKKWAYL